MYLLYSILLTVAFLLLSPLFFLRREKYASGFRERLGHYPPFAHNGRKVIWLHCVSVGEANAARPLFEGLLKELHGHRLIVSTTTKTGQELAKRIFGGKADAIFYFPFDWKFSVRRALDHFKPSLVLLMETEIWPRFIREAKASGSRVVIVNGRLSARSFARYSKVRGFMKRVLADVELALMQGGTDANRLIALGLLPARAKVTGNLKFDAAGNPQDEAAAAALSFRFHLGSERPVIIAASTHDPEERLVLDAFCSVLAGAARQKPRLIIAPRHPERFDGVARLLREFREDPACEFPRYSFARRSEEPSEADAGADIILLDSIGELRALFSYSSIAFIGGSLVPHGGQSVLEPAAAGNAIITGPHTHNFSDAVRVLTGSDAVIQLPDIREEAVADELFLQIAGLLEEPARITEMGQNAKVVVDENRGSAAKTVVYLKDLLGARH